MGSGAVAEGRSVAAYPRLRPSARRDGLMIWLVEGGYVRRHLDLDFTEGGHDLVYNYIPTGEV